MKCPSCGTQNPAGEQYCLDCGSDLTAAPSAAVSAPAVASAGSSAMSDDEFQRLLNTPPASAAAGTSCAHCGTGAPAGATFCDNCGEPIGGAAAGALAVGTAAPSGDGAGFAAAPVHPSAAPSGQTLPHVLPTMPIVPKSASGTVLLDLAGPSATSSVTMAGDDVKVGRRDAEAGIFPELDFDGNDVVVDGGERVHAVSRRHARIYRDAGALKFEDLGSTNGSTLAGAAVLPHDPQTLKDGDVIVLGRTCRITVHIAP